MSRMKTKRKHRESDDDEPEEEEEEFVKKKKKMEESTDDEPVRKKEKKEKRKKKKHKHRHRDDSDESADDETSRKKEKRKKKHRDRDLDRDDRDEMMDEESSRKKKEKESTNEESSRKKKEKEKGRGEDERTIEEKETEEKKIKVKTTTETTRQDSANEKLQSFVSSEDEKKTKTSILGIQPLSVQSLVQSFSDTNTYSYDTDSKHKEELSSFPLLRTTNGLTSKVPSLSLSLSDTTSKTRWTGPVLTHVTGTQRENILERIVHLLHVAQEYPSYSTKIKMPKPVTAANSNLNLIASGNMLATFKGDGERAFLLIKKDGVFLVRTKGNRDHKVQSVNEPEPIYSNCAHSGDILLDGEFLDYTLDKTTKTPLCYQAHDLIAENGLSIAQNSFENRLNALLKFSKQIKNVKPPRCLTIMIKKYVETRNIRDITKFIVSETGQTFDQVDCPHDPSKELSSPSTSRLVCEKCHYESLYLPRFYHPTMEMDSDHAQWGKSTPCDGLIFQSRSATFLQPTTVDFFPIIKWKWLQTFDLAIAKRIPNYFILYYRVNQEHVIPGSRTIVKGMIAAAGQVSISGIPVHITTEIQESLDEGATPIVECAYYKLESGWRVLRSRSQDKNEPNAHNTVNQMLQSIIDDLTLEKIVHACEHLPHAKPVMTQFGL